MTERSFYNYKVMITKAYSDKVYDLVKRIKLGKYNFQEITSILILNVLIDIVLNYTLFTDTEINQNSITPSNMVYISEYINKILKITYKPDFKLTD